MKKETFYFSHDYNVRTDEKIKSLIRKHGMEGYGVYWSIVEDLYNNANAMRTDYEGIAYDLRVHTNMIESIIKDFNLFQVDDEYFSSVSIANRLSQRIEKSEKAKESANKRWSKNANAMRPHSDSNAIKESKGKESKDNIVIDSSKLLNVFNSILGKNSRVVSDKAKTQIKQRIKEGYTKEDIVKAITNASKDAHHIDTSYKYITLEFITRPDKLERFANMGEFTIKRKLV